jgi:hypothetical protein
MATMSVYDCTTAYSNLARHPVDSAELAPFIDGVVSPLLGTRPFNTTYGYWPDGYKVGFDVVAATYQGFIIDYGTITIAEDETYTFDIDSDDYGELWVNGVLVAYEIVNTCTSIPIALTAGTYPFVFKFENGTGPYSFALRWMKSTEFTPYVIEPSLLGLPESNQSFQIIPLVEEESYPDRPHKLVVKTQLDGVGVSRRVEVRNRVTGAYIASGITNGAEGFIEFTHLPEQGIDEPHYILVFDDRKTEYLNALVYDRVYQVSDQGFPPEN